MVYLYLCKACEDDNHKDCELGFPCPPGQFGGSKCTCQCNGNPKFGLPSVDLFHWLHDQNKLHISVKPKELKE
jgi:hypothetical protein